ncbi:hypothetical protein TIFTF001_000710 [Ficus carica]|uniref:Uncharacterized protein n=1 Tax=Ficus carica TaxID=3494 RepID=A0AA87ZHR4_FICCA|nr:hypothetical protein TIFTF001_000710 [Ficus carica]
MGHSDGDTSTETQYRVTRRSSRTDRKAHGLSLAVKVVPLWQREKDERVKRALRRSDSPVLSVTLSFLGPILWVRSDLSPSF